MSHDPTLVTPGFPARTSPRSPAAPKFPALLTPHHAWRLLRRRTAGLVSRTSFYRWLENGRLYSLRMGRRLYIPWPALEELIQECLFGRK